MYLNIANTKDEVSKELFLNLKIDLMYLLRKEITDEEAIFLITLINKLRINQIKNNELYNEIERIKARRRFHQIFIKENETKKQEIDNQNSSEGNGK